ncbi:MAG: gliding motility-associated C-terminal domain-containing protein [Saprospiraceae bacterium]
MRENCPIYMPNIFSPNADGINDFFKPQSVSDAGIFVRQFLIFDRWGGIVYQANEIDLTLLKGWMAAKKRKIYPKVFIPIHWKLHNPMGRLKSSREM